MNRGVDHGAIFFDDLDRLEFGAVLQEAHERFGVTVLAYCLMSNHFHLLVHDPHRQLAAFMHHLTGVYARRTNARRGRDGPLFRGRYHAIAVEDDAYLLWVTRYIHRNPLDIAGVDSAREYRWSSYRTYLGLRPPPPFLDLDVVMSVLGGGLDDLVALTEDAGPERPAPVRASGAAGVRSLVACAVAVDDLGGGAPAVRVERTLAVLLARRTPDADLAQQLVGSLGRARRDAIRSAASRAERRLRTDDDLARMLAWTEDALATFARVERCLAPFDTLVRSALPGRG